MSKRMLCISKQRSQEKIKSVQPLSIRRECAQFASSRLTFTFALSSLLFSSLLRAYSHSLVLERSSRSILCFLVFVFTTAHKLQRMLNKMHLTDFSFCHFPFCSRDFFLLFFLFSSVQLTAVATSSSSSLLHCCGCYQTCNWFWNIYLLWKQLDKE